MANLTEFDTFDAGVYQLETTDVVEGGAGGISNQQGKNLANRTHYLNGHKLKNDADDTFVGLLTVTPAAGNAIVANGPIIIAPPFFSGHQYGIKLQDAGTGAGQGLVIAWSDSDRSDMARIEGVAETTGASLMFSTNSLNTGSALHWWKITPTGGFVPVTDTLVDIGTSALRVKDVYVGGVIDFDTGGNKLDFDRGADTFKFSLANQLRAELTVGGTLKLRGGTGTAGTPGGVLYEGLRVTNNTNAGDDSSISIVAGTTGVAAISLGDKDGVNVGSLKYDNSTNKLDLWANGDGTGAGGNKLTIGGGGVQRSLSPAAGDNSTEVATTAWVNALLPAGVMVPFGGGTAPSGWLECNGSAISRSTYARLFAAIGVIWGAGDGSTTFNLPESRGEFPRGWDHGRGIDAGRAVGSYQADDVDATDLRMTFEAFSEAGSGTTNHNGFVVGDLDQSLGNINNDVAIVNRTSPGGSHENRPRNFAAMFIIKI